MSFELVGNLKHHSVWYVMYTKTLFVVLHLNWT